MSQFLNNSLDVHVLWTRHNQWYAGQSWDLPCYAHSLWLMLQGEAEVSNGERAWKVTQGQAFLWPKDMYRRLVVTRDADWLSVGLLASTPLQTDLFSQLPSPILYTTTTDEAQPLESWLRLLIQLNPRETGAPLPAALMGNWERRSKVQPLHLNIIVDGLARAVFAWCWGIWGTMDIEQATQHQLPAWLIKTQQRIREDPTVSILDLAHLVGFSPAQFRRLFHQNLKQSPQQYLLNHRLEVARRLLETTDLPVGEVAVRSGFPTPTNFMNLWKRTQGISALQYRLAQRTVRAN